MIWAGGTSDSTGTAPIYGVAVHTYDFHGDALDKTFRMISDAGVTWIRFDFSWNEIEPSRDAFTWDHYDRIVASANAHGLRILGILNHTPRWANGGKNPTYPPINVNDFTNYVTRVVTRYRATVRYWEVWNEPNIRPMWKNGESGIPAASEYMPLLVAGFQAIRQVDPKARVMNAALAGDDARYMRDLYALGAGAHFDIFAFHPSAGDETPDYQISKVDRMRRVMLDYGDSAKPIWLTEFAWNTSAIRDSPDLWDNGVNEGTQARYLADFFEKLVVRAPYVQVAIWYNFRDDGTDPRSPFHNYGLVRHNYTPKPAYFAYKNLEK